MNPTEIETLAFEYFCIAHPHEAAELDWPAFLAFTRRESGMNLSEYEIRQCLVETQEKPTSDERKVGNHGETQRGQVFFE